MDSRVLQEFQQRLNYYCQHGINTEYPPHQQHQMEAHKAVIDDLAGMTKPEDFWSLMVMATGSGKSFTAGKEIKAFNTPVGTQNPVWDYPAVIVTSRLMLTDQFKRDLAEKTGIPESAIGVVSSKSKSLTQMDKPVLIVPYPTFRNLSRAGRLSPKNRPLLILDEAHNAIGFEAMQEIRKNWLGKSYIQCWTATDKLPKRTVAQVLFGSKTSQDEDDATYRLTLKQAAERGITAPLKSMVLETEFTPGVTPTDSGNIKKEDEEKIVNQKGRMQALIRLCRGDYTQKFGINFYGMKTLVFAPGIDHGKELAGEFNKIFGEGYAVAVSGEETKPHELDFTKEGSLAWRFTRGDRSSGDPVIIVTDKLVEEGIDLPAAELAIEEVATYSERVEAQRVGRVTRKLNGKAAYSVVVLDKDQEGAAIIGEMEDWELKPENFEFPTAANPRKPLPSPPSLPTEYPDIPVHVIANPKAIAEFKERRQQANTDIPPGYVDLANATLQTGVNRGTLQWRLSCIIPDADYKITVEDAEATAPQITILKGSQLTRKLGVKYIIHPLLLDSWKSPTNTKVQLITPMLPGNIPVPEGYVTLEHATAITGLERGTLQFRLGSFSPEENYTPAGKRSDDLERTDLLKGKQLAYVLANRWLIRQSLLDAWVAEVQVKQSADFIDPDTAAEQTGIEGKVLANRATKFIPDALYDDKGIKVIDPDTVESNVVICKGSDLVKKPSNREWRYRRSLVEAWAETAARAKLLEAKAYVEPAEIKRRCRGLDTYGILDKIEPDKFYSPAGLPVDEATQEKVIGNDLIWKDVYTNKVYVKPSFADAMERVVKERDELITKYRYKDIEGVAAETGMSEGMVGRRMTHIQPDGDYTEDGRDIKEVTISPEDKVYKGNTRIWRNPYSMLGILIHPSVYARWKTENEALQAAKEISPTIDLVSEKYDQLRAAKYLTTGEVLQETGLTYARVNTRLNNMQPQEFYTPDGIPTAADTPNARRGEELAWRHPTNNKKNLYAPTLVAGWKNAAEKERSLIQKQYLNVTEAAEFVGLSSTSIKNRWEALEGNEELQQQIRFSQGIASNEDLMWRDPYSRKDLLLHPKLLELWKAETLIKPPRPGRKPRVMPANEQDNDDNTSQGVFGIKPKQLKPGGEDLRRTGHSPAFDD